MIDGDELRFTCFKCEHSNPDCGGDKFCTFTKNVDNCKVNNQDGINNKFKELKEKLREQKSNYDSA